VSISLLVFGFIEKRAGALVSGIKVLINIKPKSSSLSPSIISIASRLLSAVIISKSSLFKHDLISSRRPSSLSTIIIVFIFHLNNNINI